MKTTQVLKRILKYSGKYKWYLIAGIITAVISVLSALLSPVLIGRAIDHIIGVDNVAFNMVIKYMIFLAVTVVIGGLMQWLGTALTNTLAFKTARDLRIDAFAKINKLPLSYIDTHAHGDLITKISSDIDNISDGLLHGFTQLFTGVVTVLGTVGFMLYINVWVALVVIILTPLSLLVAGGIAKYSHKAFREQAQTRGEISGYIEEMLGNAKVVKAFGKEEDSEKTFREINDRLYDCGFKAQFYSAMSNPSTRFVNNLVYAIVGIVGAVLCILSKGMTAGSLSTFLLYSNQYTKPFNEITGVLAELQNAFSSGRRVFELMDAIEETSDTHLPALSSCDGRVDIENMSFGYSKDKILINNLNLTVKSGSRIAIVGPTGCGKTTLINLLMRYYEVLDGSILVSDTPINSVTRDSLREQYGMVLQDTWLFKGTIRDNIMYGADNKSEEEMIQASIGANAHTFIEAFKDGYDTMLTENGDNLSQGQKQLLCIARIMLTEPKMLILDEATSSIDTRTELKVQEAFAKIMQGKTCFIVAHRLSTIVSSDMILVMNNGDITEKGTHKELMDKKGFYYDLYNSQYAG